MLHLVNPNTYGQSLDFDEEEKNTSFQLILFGTVVKMKLY